MSRTDKVESGSTPSSHRNRYSDLMIWVSYTLNLPALFIWAAALLRWNGQPSGEAMAAWLTSNFSELAILGMWLMLPSSALIFALGGYALNGKKWFSIGAVALSTVLLLALLYWATELSRLLPTG